MKSEADEPARKARRSESPPTPVLFHNFSIRHKRRNISQLISLPGAPDNAALTANEMILGVSSGFVMRCANFVNGRETTT